jgi:SOS response regulatory protein OraA/RecX
MRKGGYYKFGGKKYPMYQTGDMFEEENSDLVNKYPNQAMQRQEVQQRFVPQPAIYPQPEPTTTNAPQLTQTAKEQPKEVWQIWQEVTGKPWSAAKKEGFTDGSAKANMALADKLLKGEKLGPAKKVQAPVKKQTEDNRTYYGGQLNEVVVRAPKKKVAPGKFMFTSEKAYQDYLKSNRMKVPTPNTNPNLLVQINPMDFSPRKQTPMYRQAYQEGGMQPGMEAPQEGMPEQGMPQQGGGDPMQEMMAQVVSMLQQGASPQEILQQLVQAGIPQEQAAQIIQAAMQQAQGGQQATPQLGRGGQMIRRADGSYSKKGLWDNIRANAGSNKKPTKEMLDQEQKIRANEKEMGGYMYAEGGINNPGFRALPKNVQDKIISNMYQEGGQEGGMYAEQPQDQGNQMGQVVAQIAEALQQGANPDEILQQLIQMGVPEQEAAQMIQMVMQQMQQSQQAPPQQEQQMQQQTMKMGGKYLNMLRGKTIKSYTYNSKTDSYDIQYK